MFHKLNNQIAVSVTVEIISHNIIIIVKVGSVSTSTASTLLAQYDSGQVVQGVIDVPLTWR